MKIRNRIAAVALASTALLCLSGIANAAEILIQGDAFFGAGTPTTAESGASKQILFSFEVPDPLDANPELNITGATYELSGSPVAATLDSVTFFKTSQDGMFDMDFSDGTIISIYGADIGSSGNVGPAGFYITTAGVNDQFPGTANGSVTVDFLAVPEPSSWALMFAGFGGIGLMMRRARKLRGSQFAGAVAA